MTTTAIQESVLCSLISHPSRASAAAIGHQFVLNGAPPALCLQGVEALSRMPCDWGVVILEQAVEDPSRPHSVRIQALKKLYALMRSAIARGYSYLTMPDARRLVAEVEEHLRSQRGGQEEAPNEIPALEELASHLCEAVAAGMFGELPDF